MKTRPGFLENYSVADYRNILQHYSAFTSSVKNSTNDIITRLYDQSILMVSYCNTISGVDCINDFFSDEHYFIPIQLPNCKKLIISNSYYKSLGSTKGLPIKVSDGVEIIRQNDLNCNDLDYCNIINVKLIESNFKNLNFIKKWNPRNIYFRSIDFKDFSIFGDDLEILTLSNDVGNIDFRNITSLTNLKSITFENAHTNKHFPEYNKKRYINVLQILNLHKGVKLVDDTPLANVHTDVYAIINKYFTRENRSEYMMDCAMELIERGYTNI